MRATKNFFHLPICKMGGKGSKGPLNVLGTPLETCNLNPATGYLRDGKCGWHPEDSGSHLVCGIVNDDFLRFTQSRGNDLVTPRRNFPGLVHGENWCLCVFRWLEAYQYNPKIAPRIVAASTNEDVLRYVPYEVLRPYFV